MRSGAVVIVVQILAEDSFEMSAIEDDHMVCAFPANCADFFVLDRIEEISGLPAKKRRLWMR